jgi:protein-disulfide isomerase
MKKTLKPLVIIIVAVAVAAGAAMFLSREEAASPQGVAAASQTPLASPGSAPGQDPNVLPKTLPGGQGGRVRGNPNAPVTIVEFGDYQCPSCGGFHPVIKELMKREGDNVKLEFHHFPLIQIHANALAASRAAEAAGDQNRYWEMNDILFVNQSSWSALPNPETAFLTYATTLGLDGNRFIQSYRSPEVQARVLADVERGRVAQVDATPTFFINGQRVWELPQGVEQFQEIIRSQAGVKSSAK